MSADYVFRETKRSLNDEVEQCKIYPGIGIDIPKRDGEKEASPEDVYAATLASFKIGAQGAVYSRKYSDAPRESAGRWHGSKGTCDGTQLNEHAAHFEKKGPAGIRMLSAEGAYCSQTNG